MTISSKVVDASMFQSNCSDMCTSPLTKTAVWPPETRDIALWTDGSSATDEDSMAKAMRRKAEYNLDSAGMKLSPKSFLSFPTPLMSSRLSNVGVFMADSEREISFSSNALRHMVFDRLKATPPVSSKIDTSLIIEEEMHATTDGHLLSHLVGEVAEVDSDDDSRLSSLFELTASGRISKASSSKKSFKASKKAKLSKSPIVSQ